MTETTGAQGEVTLSLHGVDYLLRPSFEAIADIERELSRGILEVARQAEAGTLTLGDAGVIAAACMRAQARHAGTVAPDNIRPDSIAKRIYGEKGGLLLAMRACIYPLMAGAVLGRYTPAGEARPPTTTTS
jgi:hypothetical protein